MVIFYGNIRIKTITHIIYQSIISKNKIIMKKIFLLLAMFVITTTAMTQVKVVNSNLGVGTNTPTQKLHVLGTSYFNGNVGIGTNSPTFKLDTRGAIRLGMWDGTWESIRIDWTNQYGAATIFPEQSWYLHLGKPCKGIGYIYVHWTHDYLHSSTSDDRAKENIKRIENPIEKIKQISAYNYNFKRTIFSENIPEDEISKLTKVQIGFLAQELVATFPELVVIPNSEDELYGIHYNGMIPVLLEAIKEQQVQIENLQVMIAECCQKSPEYSPPRTPNENNRQDEMQDENSIKTTSADENEIQDIGNSAKLFQNIPNPFSVNTEIRFEIPENSVSAKLLIHDMQGAEIKSYTITAKGTGNIIIQGYELPAGMYMYTLLVNNRIVDTKKMILTK